MEDERAAGGILEDLSKEMGLHYLSDLKYGTFSIDQLSSVLSLEKLSTYSLGQWRECVSYITGVPCHAGTAGEARRTLLCYYANKSER